jgi:hypothetical protein
MMRRKVHFHESGQITSSEPFPDRNQFPVERAARSEASPERTTESGFSNLPVVSRGDVEFRASLTMIQARRRVFVEDRGADAIRTRLREEKEREAVEKAERAAKAEEDAEPAAQAAAEETAKRESEKGETAEDDSAVSDSN